MRRPEVCLDPSTTREHVAYIPAVRPTLTGSFSPSPIATQSRCHCSCLKHQHSWPRSGWHVATGLKQSLQVVYSLLAANSHARLCFEFGPAVCSMCGETTQWDVPLFFSHHFPPIVIYPLFLWFSLPLLILVSFCSERSCFQLDLYSVQVQIEEAVIFFSPLFNFVQRHPHFLSLILAIHDMIFKSP